MWLLVVSFVVAVFALHLYTRMSRGITRSSSCLVDKTALITGANTGLGYQTALNLASRGCRVIMADVADMNESKLNIIKYTNNPNIVTKKLDLSSLKSVRDFASDILETEPSLNILINNAGIGISEENRTPDGLNPVMQVNFFGHFLLTHLLVDLLQNSAPSRIIFTSSGMAFANNLSINNFNFDLHRHGNGMFTGYRIYGNSKLAMIIASDIFAEKLKGKGVTSNCVHPGLLSTQMYLKAYLVSRNIFYLLFTKLCHLFFAKDAWEGSQVLIHAAVSKKVENITGSFFADCKAVNKPTNASKPDFCKKIWTASEEYVGLKPNEKL